MVLGLVGIALLWRQADEVQRERWLDTGGRIDPVRVVFGSGGWAAYARVAAGIGLVLVAVVIFSLHAGDLGVARDITVAALLGIVGLAIVVGPWVFRLAADLTAERAERVRVAGAGRRRRPPARLRAADAGPDPEERRRRADGGPPGPRPGARPAVVAVRRRVHRRAQPRLGAARRGRRGRGRPRRHRRRRHRRRLPDERGGAAARQRHPRGGHQRGQARRHRAGRRLRRGDRPSLEVFVRDRGAASTPTTSPTTGSASGTASSTGWSATAARPRSAPLPARAPRSGSGWSSTRPERPTYPGTGSSQKGSSHERAEPCPRGHRRRPRDVPARGARRARATPSTWWPRPATSTRRWRPSLPHHPDVVLLDVHLPGGGGVEVMRRAPVARGPLPRALGQRRRRGRHRHHPRRCPRLRHQDHHRARAGRGDPPGRRRRRGVLPAAGGLRARRVRRLDRGRRRSTRTSTGSPSASAR